MKERGFTLIELLAVIVILAVLALIAVPVVLNIVGNTKTTTNKASIDLYAKAVKQSMTKEEMDSYSLDGSYKTNDGKTLENGRGNIEVDYDGNSVVCDVIVINEDQLFLNKCKVNGKEVDYSYGHIEGDIDGDGLVTAKDLKMLKNMIAGNEEVNDWADLDGDGLVTAKDVVLLQKLLTAKYDLNEDGVADSSDSAIINSSDKYDIDGDGFVTAKDLKMLENMIAGNEEVNDKADINGDGIVDARDTLMLKNFLSSKYDLNGDGIIDTQEKDMYTSYFEVKGDVNNDGVVDCLDYEDLKEFNAGVNTVENLAKADIDGNGKITTKDLFALRMILSYYGIKSCNTTSE